MLVAPVGPADVYSAALGGIYGYASAGRLPCVAGHDGVGLVARVGPGVKGALAEGDLVQPAAPLMGTWRAAAVWRAKALTRVGSLGARWRDAAGGGGAAAAAICRDAAGAAGAANGGAGGKVRGEIKGDDSTSTSRLGGGVDVLLPLEYLAVSRELLAAYRLLEMHDLKPGDCVILNAPNSTVGRAVLQLARLLKLRTLALLRPPAASPPPPPVNDSQGGVGPARQQGAATDTGDAGGRDEARWRQVAERLVALGATHVLRDEGAIQAQLGPLKHFARPSLALDAVGGASAARMADALCDGGTLVVYGCLGGAAPALDWKAYVFRGLTLKGFNARAWAAAHPSRAARALASISRLVAAGLLSLEFTEYEFKPEWRDAAEHAAGEQQGGPRGGSRALMMMPGLAAFRGHGGAEP
ncbi:DnaJ-like protein [Monoraphidium neglectum]|uniref:DnaJ-like protein n=1 Tax=Monoraphidium neglectum TaxID=145388 RepID=A0A0D2KEQ5_9CHLO|nr:DnaJ-like protein [Monoraphidium neglectum]KIY94338.1 DnaJ-like protein [Monoraphidium neglectum]|eukprot:XP_013893358.1 DnaJ-like protein [Monoraphidium neglectum]